MIKKDKIKFILAIVISFIGIALSFTVIESGIEMIFDPEPGNELFDEWIDHDRVEDEIENGMASHLTKIVLAVLYFGIAGILAACALGAFFAFSLRKHENNTVKTVSRVIFGADVLFILLNILSLCVILL